MKAGKWRALEAAGWKLGDAADFLEMTDEERQLLDARVELALAVRRQREVSRISQKELAARIKSSQPRVAKIERAAPDVSLDQLVRAFTAAGGKFIVKAIASSQAGKPSEKATRGKKPASRPIRLELRTTE